MVRMPNRIVMPPSAKKMNGLKFSKSKLPDNLKFTYHPLYPGVVICDRPVARRPPNAPLRGAAQ